jgi:RNA 2',3'-cyclic 3'-phosphodiesterase
MRTFIAIPLPAESRTMLDKMQQSLRVHRADVRWVAIPSIHLTLKFLGEVDPEIIPKLSESIADASRSECPVGLRLQGLGCFPNLRMPRVVWCGIGGETEALSRLQHKVETACAAFGFAPEERAFHPHLTLGRVNGKKNLQPLIECIKIGSDLECRFQADHFDVYKSVLKPQGAEYTVLKTITLSGEGRTDPANHEN